jgi:hypothetical protein
MNKALNIVQCTFCGKEIKFGYLHECTEKKQHLKKMNTDLQKEWEAMKKEEVKIDDPEDLTESQIAIVQCMDSMKEFLLEKNRRYGDSALHPKRVFSKATTDEQLLVRLDDKISRIQNSTELRRNDIIDLLGYSVLLCVSKGWTDFSDLLD